jgi:hypothetical protein
MLAVIHYQQKQATALLILALSGALYYMYMYWSSDTVALDTASGVHVHSTVKIVHSVHPTSYSELGVQNIEYQYDIRKTYMPLIPNITGALKRDIFIALSSPRFM